MKTKLLSLFLVIAMLASATLIPTSATAEEVTPDATPVSDVDTSANEATPMPEETPLAEAEPEASPAPVVDAPAATVADESLFTYTVESGKATITDADTSISGDIIIPDTLGGYPVTSIGTSAFYGCTGLTSVTIPNSVTSIGASAFEGCMGLTSVTIPNSVTSIGDHTFSGCTGLQSVTAPISAFTSIPQENLKTIVINGGGTIAGGTFQNNTTLISVTISEGISEIGYSAFNGCTSLVSLTISEGLTKVGWGAFANCTALPSIVIPASLTDIASSVFQSCTSLREVAIAEGATVIGVGQFQVCSSLETITIPASMKTIGSVAFKDCKNLKFVTILSAEIATAITEERACGDLCRYAKAVLIPSSVRDIGSYLAQKMTNVTSCVKDDVPYTVYADHEHSYTVCVGGAWKVCSVCNFTDVDPCVLGHDMLDATCLEPATCTRCGHAEGEALGHTWGDWEETVAPTYSSDGVETRVCTRDASHTETRVKPVPSLVAEWTCGDGVTARLFADERNAGKYTLHVFGTGAMENYTATTMPWADHITEITTVIVYDGVTSIGAYAFYGATALTSLTLSASVTSIGYKAFAWCSSLTSVTIPDSVTSIGDDVFAYCHSLTSVTIGNKVTSIGNYAFQSCSSLTSVTIPDSVTRIGNSAFYDCRSLTSVTIPDSVTSIDWYAFQGCSSLTSVTIGNSVTGIDEYAFSGCSSLTSVYITDLAAWCKISFFGYDANPLHYAHNLYLNGELVTDLVIPDSVTSIGNYAFCECYSLTSVTIESGSIGDYAFSGCSSLTSVTIESGSIGDYAFSGCSSLTSVTIPDSVTSIGEYAFCYCSSLTSVTIGNSVTGIGSYAFEGCSSLTSVTIESGSIGDSAFWYCSSLTSVTIGNGVTGIGWYAFRDCSSLTSVTIGNSVTWIGSDAFEGCSSLTSVTIGNSVTGIGAWAFAGCSSLTSVTIPDSVTSISEYAFSGCTGLTSVTIGNSVTSIDTNAFVSCAKIIEVYNRSSLSIAAGSDFYGYVGYYAKNVYTPSSGESKLFTLGDFLFYNDNGSYLLVAYTGNDTDITLPDTVNGKEYAIYDCAFYYRDDLTSVTIGGSVMSIGNSAFFGCSSLTSVTIGNSVTSIGSFAFSGCSSLTSVTIVPGNTKYHSAGNCLIETATKTLILGCKNSIIPTDGSVTSIGSGAFSSCSSLTSVTIPDSVTSIGERAFYNCDSLTSVTIPDSVTSIGEWAFYDCDSLTSVYITDLAAWCKISFDGYYANPLCNGANLYLNGELVTELVIPDSVTSIGNYAFYSCDSLTSVTIPVSVTSIGNYAFQYCFKLIEVYNRSSLSITKGSSSCGYVGYYAKNVYTPLSGESKFFTFGDYLFYNDNGSYLLVAYTGNDTDISLPDTVNGKGYEIYKYAFAYRDDLTVVVIPDSVTSIGEYAFWSCSSLTSVTIPDSVTSIGDHAFQYCSSLVLVTIESATIARNLTSSSSYGYLINYAQTVLIPASITTVGSYVTNIFTNRDAITMDGVLCTVYSKHSHADASVWDGNTCTDPTICSRCGMEGEPLGHDMQEATCTLPSTCSRCDHTEGDALGHAMAPADCVTPSTCTRCGHTEGDALGHIMAPADCLTPSTCTRCGHTEGDALGHVMTPADCLTPSTCDRCGHTEGDALGHDMQDATCTLPSTCSRCGHAEGEALGHAWGEWEETVAPTHRSDGEEIRVCTNDPTHIETRVIPAYTFIEQWVCGDGVTAELYPDDKNEGKYLLVIDGTGAMNNFGSKTMPWADHITEITTVTVYDGVTSIGASAFYGATALTSLTLSASVTSIGDSAFRNCTALTSVSEMASMDTIGKYAFFGCTAIPALAFGEDAKLSSVGLAAFLNCRSLQRIVLKNETAIAALTARTAHGYLINVATTILLPKGATAPTFITTNYTYVDEVIDGGVAYTVYSKHSHAQDSTVWSNDTCTECGVTRGPALATGDINADGIVDIADIATVIDAASGTELDPADYPGDPDVNADGVVDIADIAKVIDVAAGTAS